MKKLALILALLLLSGCMTAGSLSEKMGRMQAALESAQKDIGRAQETLSGVDPDKELDWSDWLKILGGLAVTGGTSILGVNAIRDKKYVAPKT